MPTIQNAESYLNRVLLIADDTLAATILAKQLRVHGHEVQWAKDSIEAGRLWERHVYDLVIVDLKSDLDGGRCIVEQIKASAPDQRITFVSRIEKENKRRIAQVREMPRRS